MNITSNTGAYTELHKIDYIYEEIRLDQVYLTENINIFICFFFAQWQFYHLINTTYVCAILLWQAATG